MEPPIAGINILRAKSREYSPDAIGLWNVSVLGGLLGAGNVKCIFDVTSTSVIASFVFSAVRCDQQGRVANPTPNTSSKLGTTVRARAARISECADRTARGPNDFPAEPFTFPCLSLEE